MRRVVLSLLFCFCAMHATGADIAPYHVSFSGNSVPWQPLAGTTVNVNWREGTFVPMILPARPIRLFGIDFMPSDTVDIFLQGNGTFLVFTPTVLALVDGVFCELDSQYAGARIQYKVEDTPVGGMIRLRYDSVSIGMLDEPNFVSFEMQIHYDDGAIELIYGPSSENTRNITKKTAQPFVGVSMQTPDFTAMYSKVWLHGDPNNPTIDTSKTIVFPGLRGVPVPGTRIRFTPTTTTSVDDVATDLNAHWRNVDVEVLDILGRHLLWTTTTADGSIPSSLLPRGAMVVRNTKNALTRLMMID